MTLLLTIAKRIVWRSWRPIEARWGLPLHMTRHTGLPLRLLVLWRSQARSTLSTASHDTLEKVCGAMTNRRWWRLRGPRVRALRWTTSLFELVSQTCDFLLVSTLC